MGRNHNIKRAALVLLTVIASLLCVAVAAPPTVSVRGGNTFEAGNVPQKQAVTHVFTVQNPHPYPVRLWLPPPEGCSCLTIGADQATIAAFGAATVSVSVAGSGSRGDQTEGARVLTAQGNRQRETWLFLHFNRRISP